MTGLLRKISTNQESSSGEYADWVSFFIGMLCLMLGGSQWKNLKPWGSSVTRHLESSGSIAEILGIAANQGEQLARVKFTGRTGAIQK